MASIRNLDLHQITALDHLLRERSVTGAAQRLGISQPATSSLLAKLRRHFDDELLVRHGGRYVLTPVGTLLAERTPDALAQIHRLIDVSSGFDPATTTRRFTFAGSDHFSSMFGPAIVRSIMRQAPLAEFRLAPIGIHSGGDLASRLLELDGLMLPRGSVPDLPAVDLFTDEWVFVVCRRNPLATALLDVADLRTSPWVAFRGEGAGLIPPIGFLNSQGLEFRTEVSVSDFASVPFLVSGTDRIGVMPRNLAKALAKATGTVVLESPVLLPSITTTMVWHPAHELDPAHAWLRNLLARIEF